MDWVRFHNYKVHSDGTVTDLVGKQMFVHNRRDGYQGVLLTYDGCRHYHLIHRLVAEQFIPNPDNLPQVHHKDSNRCHNSIENLEWTTGGNNMIYSARDRGLCMAVSMTDIDGATTKFYSLRDASRSTGLPSYTIKKCAMNSMPDKHGNIWRVTNG